MLNRAGIHSLSGRSGRLYFNVKEYRDAANIGFVKHIICFYNMARRTDS